MENYKDLLLDDQLVVANQSERRRNLLPPWIKVFTWIFLIFGGLVPVAFLLGLFGVDLNLSLYGMETNTTFSLAGVVLLLLFAIKGIVAYGLWTEKKWAANLAIYDAILGILVCCVVMFAGLLSALSSSLSFTISFRVEIFVLIPYLLRMQAIKRDWEALEV